MLCEERTVVGHTPPGSTVRGSKTVTPRVFAESLASSGPYIAPSAFLMKPSCVTLHLQYASGLPAPGNTSV